MEVWIKLFKSEQLQNIFQISIDILKVFVQNREVLLDSKIDQHRISRNSGFPQKLLHLYSIFFLFQFYLLKYILI